MSGEEHGLNSNIGMDAHEESVLTKQEDTQENVSETPSSNDETKPTPLHKRSVSWLNTPSEKKPIIRSKLLLWWMSFAILILTAWHIVKIWAAIRLYDIGLHDSVLDLGISYGEMLTRCAVHIIFAILTCTLFGIMISSLRHPKLRSFRIKCSFAAFLLPFFVLFLIWMSESDRTYEITYVSFMVALIFDLLGALLFMVPFMATLILNVTDDKTETSKAILQSIVASIILCVLCRFACPSIAKSLDDAVRAWTTPSVTAETSHRSAWDDLGIPPGAQIYA